MESGGCDQPHVKQGKFMLLELQRSGGRTSYPSTILGLSMCLLVITSGLSTRGRPQPGPAARFDGGGARSKRRKHVWGKETKGSKGAEGIAQPSRACAFQNMKRWGKHCVFLVASLCFCFCFSPF